MQLQAFTFGPSLSLRVIERDGEPWFVAKDVCDALGLRVDNVRAAADPDEYETLNVSVSNGKRGGARRLALLSESGLYTAIIRSDKDTARPFRKWVTREVLPAIRKRGAFMTQDTAQRVIDNAQEGVRIAHEQLASARKGCPIDRLSALHTKPRTAGASSFLDPTCPHAFSRPGSMSDRPSR